MNRVESLVQRGSDNLTEHAKILDYGLVGEATLAVLRSLGYHLCDERPCFWIINRGKRLIADLFIQIHHGCLVSGNGIGVDAFTLRPEVISSIHHAACERKVTADATHSRTLIRSSAP